MKKTFLLKTMLLLCALVVGSSSVWGQNWTGTVNSTASNLNTTNKTYTFTVSNVQYVWSYDGTTVAAGSPSVTIGSDNNKSAIKFGSSGSAYFSPVVLSTGAFNDYAVTKVRLSLRHNGKKQGTLTVKQDDITIGTATSSNSNEDLTITCSETNKGEGGTLTISYSVAQALYVKKIEVWYETLTIPAHTLSASVSPNSSGTVTLGATSVREGKKTTISATPNEGYTFSSWTVSGAGSSVTNASAASTTFTMGTENATVTANFTEATSYVVTYNYNDGVTANEIVNVPFADAATYTLKAAPSRVDYNFLGWKIGETTYNAGAAYEPTANVTAIAQWEFVGALTTYNRSSKSDLATGAKYVLGASYTSGSTTTWKYAKAMGGNTYLMADVVGEHGSLDADNAVFYNETPEIITLNETADGWTMTSTNGKIGMTGDKKIGYNNGDTTWDLGGSDDVPQFSANNVSKTYILKFNWNSGNSRFTGYESGQQDVYFYRLDDGKDVYILTLDYNYGNEADATHRVLEGATYSLPIPTRSGYHFVGWNTVEGGTGTNNPAGDYTMPSANTTLYAQWAETAPITITSAGWASFSSDVELQIPSGVTAYYAAPKDDNTVTLTKITEGYIPANTGVVVSGTAGSYDADVTTTNATLGEVTNLLKPWLTAGEPTETTYYTLAVDSSKNPVFYTSTGGTLAAGKAYLVMSGTTAPSLVVSFGESTGVNDVKSKTEEVRSEYFNIAGQRVAQPTKGLYIVNGKKYVVK